jgi:hypothetical protein
MLIITWGMNNRPTGGHSLDMQSHPDINIIIIITTTTMFKITLSS